MAKKELTPMMRQYQRIKSELPEGVILLFRLGDFYELFLEDAKVAAPVLGVALTKRMDIPMCGVPHHALDNYLAKLIRAGYKAAICEQVEDPAQAKGIVRREVTRVVTPGTILEEEILDAERHNYLAAIFLDQEIGVALLDISTGTFTIETVADPARLEELLRRHRPSECLVSAEQRQDKRVAFLNLPDTGIMVTEVEGWVFEYAYAYDRLVRHFAVHSLEGFGCEEAAEAVSAAGALLYYIEDTLRCKSEHIRSLEMRSDLDYLMLDNSTTTNLELLPRSGQNPRSTLMGVMNATLTPMGTRLLRNWILRPLRRSNEIQARLNTVTTLYNNRTLLQSIRNQLGVVKDLERLIVRINTERCNGRDLKTLSTSLQILPLLRTQLDGNPDQLLQNAAQEIHPLPEIMTTIEAAITAEPPVNFKDGGVIQDGYHAELDELRLLASKGHQWLAEYQTKEQARTGIKTLKVRYNRVFGYYIEISRGQAGAAPPEYERRQTLTNAERFTTSELKEYESKILHAQEQATALEIEIFEKLRQQVVSHTAQIQSSAHAIATLDVLCALTDRALALGYVCPEISDGDMLEIKDGRHPVIEQLPDAERFVPNDTQLDITNNQIMVLTGPNMAGKSTYIRQVALIAIMAHIGSYVPASQARISTLDRIFTRIGAGDDLARGRSTFMVEMQESANILNNATTKSLIILDELGRGTSTFDGISIAWSVVEHLHNTPSIKAKTLFATHYHELTDLALTLRGVKNFAVQVREHGKNIIFLRRILAGIADKSYGIHVAQLAGMPVAVVNRACEVLSNLEESELDAGVPKLAKRSKPEPDTQEQAQMTLFGSDF